KWLNYRFLPKLIAECLNLEFERETLFTTGSTNIKRIEYLRGLEPYYSSIITVPPKQINYGPDNDHFDHNVRLSIHLAYSLGQLLGREVVAVTNDFSFHPFLLDHAQRNKKATHLAYFP